MTFVTMKKALLLLVFVSTFCCSFAQFDTEFYFPPLWRTSEAATNDPSTLVVTTPYPQATVHIRTPDHTTFNQTFVIGKGNLLRLPLSTSLGQSTTINTPNTSRGLIITSDFPVQVVHRITSVNNKSMATLKGRFALGTDFWPGSQTRLIATKYGDNDYHFLSVMATENGTKVTVVSPYNMQGKTTKTFVFTLNKHETYLMRSNNNATEPISGIHVTSDKPIAVISGTQHGRIKGTGFDAADAGIDQIVPIEHIGNQYLVVRGAAVATADYAVIIATKNNTTIAVDGVNRTTLNKGGVYEYQLPGGSSSVGDGHYIESNNDIYVYHVTGAGYGVGDDEVGMSIIPPIGCNGSRYIEFNKFPTTGGQSIIIYVPTDALSTLKFNGNLYSSYAGIKQDFFPSRPDWRTVVIPNQHIQENNVVESDGFMHVGVLVGSTSSGTYGFLSGFHDEVQILEPLYGLVSHDYILDTLVSGETIDHCLTVASCGEIHKITNVSKNIGTVQVKPPSSPYDTCFKYTAPNNYSGVDTVRLVVTNEFGVTGTVDVYFYINYNYPEAIDDDVEFAQGGSETKDVSANDFDANGNLDPSSVTIVTDPTVSGATAISNGDGTISLNYSAVPNFQGIDSVRYAICDFTLGTPLCDSAWVHILVNGFPDAVTDNASVNEDASITVDVQVNDTDPNNDPLTTRIVSGPTNGNATVLNGDSIMYIPIPDYYGSDMIIYQVCDKFDQCDSDTLFITVNPVNDRPVVDLDFDNSVSGGLNYATTFVEDAGAVKISDIDPYVYDLDDPQLTSGSVVLTNPLDGANETLVYQGTDPAVSINGSGAMLTITGPLTHAQFEAIIKNVAYLNNSNTPNLTTRVIEVTVSDTTLTSEKAIASISIVATNDAPVGGDAAVTLSEDETYTFALGDFNQGYSDPEGQALNKIRIATLPASGTLFYNGVAVIPGRVVTIAQIPLLTFKPAQDAFGSPYTTFQFSVSDGSKYSVSRNTITINVLPVNDKPVANDDYAAVDVNEVILIDVQGNDLDVDGDELFTIIISQPAVGSAVVIGTDSILYTAGPNITPRIDTIIYQVCDLGLLCDTALVLINVPKSQLPPYSTDDVAFVDEDSTVLIDVLANDFDPNSDSIFISSIINGPSKGIALIENGEVRYTPNPDFNGNDQFDYVVCDTNATVNSQCDTATVMITVNPVDDIVQITDSNGTATDTLRYTTLEDIAITIKVGVIEVDGDFVDVVNVINGPSNGVITGLSNFDTTFTYTPNLNFNGVDTMQVVVCANGKPTKCDTAVVIITVIPVNDKPVAEDDVSATDPGTEVIIDVQANDFDVDGDVLTTTIITDPTRGDAAVINGDSISYVPFVGVLSGFDTLTYQVCDADLLCDTAVVVISIPKNQLPPFVTDDIASVDEDAVVLIDVLANDIDPNGDSIFISSIINGPANGVAVIMDGVVQYTPDPDFNGGDSFQYIVCDFPLVATSQCDTGNVTITVNPIDDQIVIVDSNGNSTDTLFLSTLEDTPIEISINVVSIDRDSVDVVNVINGPSNGVITGLSDGDTALIYSPNQDFNGVDTFQVVVCAIGNPSKCDTVTIVITVIPVNDAPIIIENSLAIDSTTRTVNEDMQLFVQLDVIDPDGDSVDLVQVIQGPSNGTILGLSDGDTALVYIPNQDFNGLDTIVAVVCDNGVPVLCDTVVIVITVIPVNDDPVVTEVTHVTTNQGDPIKVCLESTDIDGDILDVTAVISGPNSGSVVGIGTGDTCFTYIPDSTFSGFDTVIVIVCDPFGGCDTAIVIITVIPNDNSAPLTTNPLFVSTLEDTPINIKLISTDPDGDSIDVTSVVNGPLHGFVTGFGDGDTTFTYNPDLNYNGSDTVYVTLCDVYGACDTVLVAITVTPVNDAPVIVDSAMNSLEAFTVLTIRDTIVTIRLNAIDVDNDAVDVVTIINGPSNGTITGLGTGDTTFTYTSDSAFVGIDVFDAIVCDNQSPALCDTVRITVVVSPLGNHNPFITDGTSRVDTVYAVTDEDVAVLISLIASDFDNDTLDVVSIIDGPSNGTITGLNDGDTSFTYTPDHNFNGFDTMRAVVCDPFLGCDTAVVIVTVNPVNDDPIIVNNDSISIDSMYTVVIVNDTLVLCLNAIDPDGDVVDVVATACEPDNGAITGLSDGDMCLSYIPNNDFVGADTICVVVCDGFGGCDTLIVSIDVISVNNPPDLTDTTIIVIDENVSVEVCLIVTDPDNDAIQIGIIGGVANGAISGLSNGDTCFRYTPDTDFVGYDTIKVVVCDDGHPSACDTGIVIIQILNVNQPPVAVDDTVVSETNNDVTIDVLINDFDPDNEPLTVSTTYPGAIVNADGSITYTPETDFSGEVLIPYTICDPGGLCDDAVIVLQIIDNSLIIVGQGITPNGDGFNDVFTIKGIENFPDNNVQIFNRWGNVVFEKSGYDNGKSKESWEGQSNKGSDKMLPSGTYFYLLELNDEKGREFSGFVVLKRDND